MMRRGVAVVGALLALLIGVLLVAPPGTAPAPVPGSGTSPSGCAVLADHVPGAAESGLPVRPLCALPPEAARVWEQIRAGGPFDYDRDGLTFRNRERLLPIRASDFYREYTVATPGEDDRGARRLVTGGDRGPEQELYYTADHYASFVVVDATAVP